MIAIAIIMKKIPTQKNPGKSDHLYVQLMEYLMNGFSCGMLNKAFFCQIFGHISLHRFFLLRFRFYCDFHITQEVDSDDSDMENEREDGDGDVDDVQTLMHAEFEIDVDPRYEALALMKLVIDLHISILSMPKKMSRKMFRFFI